MADNLTEVFQKIGEGAAKFGESAMQAAEKAFNEAKDFSQNVVEHSQNMQKGAKLNADFKAKKQELEDAYNKLGRLAYQQGGLSGEMQDVSDKIHQIYQELQTLELQMNKN